MPSHFPPARPPDRSAEPAAPAQGDARGPGVARGVDAAPFQFAGDRRGVLLVHGFTGTPFEMRLLGESLAERGYTVRAPQLAGHDLGILDLGGTAWPDWLATVEDELDALASSCDVVGVCGLSLGGLLTLELARRRGPQVAAIAVLSAPVFLPRWQMSAIRFARERPQLRRLAVPRLAGSDIADSTMRHRNPHPVGGMPVRALGSLIELMDHVRPRLGEIDRPALVAHARRDHVVPWACADAIAGGLRGPVERLDLERSFHVITLDVERGLLFRRVGEFFDRHLSERLPGLPRTETARATGSP